MKSYLPLSFVRKKIEELQHALMFSMSDSVLKLPACVVNIIQTDELGQIWFAIPKPSQYIHEFDRTFAAKLDFFRKEKNFYMKILGKAFMVIDPEDINSIIYMEEGLKQKARNNEIVLIKVSITHADYFEKITTEPVKINSVFQNIRTLLNKWFFDPQHGHDLSGFKKIPVGAVMNKRNIISN